MRLIRLFLTTVTAVGSYTQHPPLTGSDRSPELMFHSSTNLVLVDVIALDAKTGAPDQTLKREDFQILDNGNVAPIRTLDSELQSRPLALWFVVQCNMQGWEKQGSGLFAGREHLFEPALKWLEKRDTVAVAHFCDDGQSQLDLLSTGDTGQAIASVERVLLQYRRWHHMAEQASWRSRGRCNSSLTQRAAHPRIQSR